MLRDGDRLLDARAQFFYLGTGITPAMARAHVGAGSAYAYTAHDADGAILDGARSYRLHIDPDVPAKTFCAIDIFETILGKSWFAIVRIYGPLQPWFDQTWRSNDIQPNE